MIVWMGLNCLERVFLGQLSLTPRIPSVEVPFNTFFYTHRDEKKTLQFGIELLEFNIFKLVLLGISGKLHPKLVIVFQDRSSFYFYSGVLPCLFSPKCACLPLHACPFPL